MSLEEPRQSLLDLMPRVDGSRYREHLIQLLECELLGLRDPEEDEDEGEEVETSVEEESAGWCESTEQSGEGETEDGGPEETP